MTVTKEYLEETREIVTTLQDMADEITRLKEKAIATPAQLFSDVRVQTTKKTDAMADRIVRYADLEELYTQMYDSYIDRSSVINRAIRSIPFREQLVIILHYIRGESVQDICDVLYIANRTFYRRLHSALAHIAEKGQNDGDPE